MNNNKAKAKVHKNKHNTKAKVHKNKHNTKAKAHKNKHNNNNNNNNNKPKPKPKTEDNNNTEDKAKAQKDKKTRPLVGLLCAFCSTWCKGKCEEWKRLGGIVKELMVYTKEQHKKEKEQEKRVYKTEQEMLNDDYVSYKCIDCRLSRKVCDGTAMFVCTRCLHSKIKLCRYDPRAVERTRVESDCLFENEPQISDDCN